MQQNSTANPSIGYFCSFNLPRQVFYFSFELRLLVLKLHRIKPHITVSLNHANNLVNSLIHYNALSVITDTQLIHFLCPRLSVH